MKNITILDDSFDLNLSAIYHISLQISLNSYSFCILNSVRNKYIAIKHFNFSQALTADNFNKEMKRILENDEFLNKRYKSVKFSWISTKYTFVPTEMLTDLEPALVLKFNASLDSKEEVEKTILNEGKITQLFAFPSYLSTILATQYKDVKLYNQTTAIVNNAIKAEKLKKSGFPSVYIEIFGKQLNTAVADANGLLFSNSFECRNDSDIVYHIVNIYEQLKLTTNLNELYLSGDFPLNSTLFNQIKKFIKNVNLLQPSPNFTYSESFTDIPHYIFANLYNLYECE